MRKVKEGRFAEALDGALRIGEPWYRVQALAEVAWCAPENEVQRVAEIALRSAKEGRDVYQQVAVTAWIFAALVQRGKEAVVAKHLPEILADSHCIEPPPSKVEALYNLWNALYKVPGLQSLVLSVLVQVCETAGTWRAGRVMRTVVTVIAEKDRFQAESLWTEMPENRYKRQTRRMLDTGQVDPVKYY